jgi:PAS domain S-box-containing protein
MSARPLAPVDGALWAHRALDVAAVLDRSQIVGLTLVDADGRIVHANEQGARQVGTTAAELVGRPLVELLDPDEAQRIAQIRAHHPRGKEDFHTASLRRVDGRRANILLVIMPLPGTAQGAPALDLGLFIDLGQLFDDGDTLVKNASLYQGSFDLLASPVFVKDLDGRYRLCNRAFSATILGLPRDQIVGRTMEELSTSIPADLLARYRRMDDELLQAGGEQIYTTEVRCADGRRREFELRKTVLQGPTGQANGLIGIMVDVSRRLQAERALAQSLAEAEHLNTLVSKQRNLLVQSERMASLGQLAAGVAHEINNPLSYVRSNLQALNDYVDILAAGLVRAQSLLEAGGAVDAADRQAFLHELAAEDLDFISVDAASLVDECLQGVERIRGVVDGLRGFACHEPEKNVLVAVDDLVEAALLSAEAELPERCEVDVRCATAPRVRCHREQIEQVIVNLVVNAAQAIGDRGRIVIAAAAHPEGVCISVTDDGPGMNDGVRERVFEPFFTTKEQGQGTGLGLHIVATIVQRHGGRVAVTSQPGAGATFEVILPLDPIS